VAVSDYAQFAELPDDVVFKVPLGVGEVERLVEFFTSDLPSPAEKQRAWLEENAALEKTVEGYLRAAFVSARESESGGIASALQMFPELELISVDPLVIKNVGDATIRTRVYGEPEYRLIVKWFVGEAVVHDQWLALPKDLHPGETVEIELQKRDADTLRLYHALQDIPMLEPEPWETARVR